MVFSVSPSVTVREVDLTTVIPALATPPAGIAGVFRWGPVGERILITSEQELADRFGKPTDFNAETFFTAADFLAYSNALYVVRANPGLNTTAANTNFEAKYPGALGNSIEVSYVTDTGFEELFAEDDILQGDITFNSNEIELTSFIDIDVVLVENDILRIGNDNVGYQDMIINTYTVTEEVNANTAETEYTYSFTFKNRYTLPELDATFLTFEKKWGFANVVGIPPEAGNLHIVVVDRGGEITGTAGTILEVYNNVSTSSTAKLADGSTNYYLNVIENRSAFIAATTTPIVGTSGYQLLAGGSDGANEQSVAFGALAAAYDLFSDTAEVDISFILQGKANSSNISNYIAQNIAERRKDCIAYLSPRKSDVVDPSNPITKMNNVIEFRNQLQSSSYWFLDSGYKYRYDKYNDIYRWIPLNGDMAGLAARVEPWESPAGFKRGIIKNVVKLAFNPNKAQRDQLYGRDINPVISQVGQGVLLFGDKTGLGRPSAFDRINVRRLFITVEKAIANVSASFLFDFNDEFTQTQFKNIVEPFLRDIQGRRGIIDFRVVADGRVNTPDVIDRNIFRGNIFIKPAKSISFIELTFIATRTGIEFDEIVGQQL
jgi:hypothetical protein